MSDLERAVQALKTKGREYDLLWRYYDGDQPLRYSTKRLQEVFSRLDVIFTMNWCEVVVNAVLDKLILRRFLVTGDDRGTERLNDLWWRTGMKLDDDDVHLGMLVCGEAFVFVWDDPEYGLEAYYNDPRLCHIFYEPNHPRVKRLGCKWWMGDDRLTYLNLYYPDRIEYYRTQKRTRDGQSGASAREELSAERFQLVDTRAHKMGLVPIFHFQRTGRGGTHSELSVSVLSLQDAINKLLADMMVAAEFGAFKQRYIISSVSTQGQLRNAPNEIWDIPAGDGYGQDTSVGEFGTTDLANFLDPIEKMATAVAVITRTPRHYFFEKVGSNPSGEALMAMDASLNTKAARYVERLEMAWSAVAAFMLRLDGYGEVDRRAIETIYRDPRTLQPMTQAQSRVANVNAGMPLTTVLRHEGWSDEDIAQMMVDRDAEEAARQDSLARALLEQQRRFDREEDPLPNSPPRAGEGTDGIDA